MIYVLAAAAAFNLVCSGTHEAKSIAANTSEPYSTVFRIDLGSNKWCEGECRDQMRIFRVTPVRIVLQATNEDGVSQRLLIANTIDRETGHHSSAISTGRGSDIIMLKWEGECEKQPFSGFPTVKTKF